VNKRKTILAIIATDRTFDEVEWRGQPAWMGKCLHCNTHLYIGLDGEPISRATIEHIVPSWAGGSEELENLGIACSRCNQTKGSRIDPLYPSDPRAVQVLEKLQKRRRVRWKKPSAQ
jgi:5-methylcytosine-specific restriction endonuclease McrA